MDYDVLIVGAGPSGLAAGIRIKQKNPMLSVCILDKGAQIGAHLLSGAVLELQSLKKLLPDDWTNAPLGTPVTKDAFYWLSKRHAIRLPTPKPMTNRGNHIISLSLLCQYLAEKATLLGCDVYPGFAAVDALFHEQGHVMGVISGDVGIDAHGTPGENFQAGIPIHAQQTLFAEGCRGQVSEKLIHHFQLRQGIQPQTYGLGIKEIWRIDPQNHQQGHVLHTIGWPLDTKTYGGSFVYHQNDHQIALGLVAGLDYKNPYFSPFEEMQRFKTHPKIARLLKNGERLAYGARALNEGGWQSIPKLTFPGGALIGDAAGFLNVAKIKGIHHAIESGILAADACVLALSTEKKSGDEIINYQEAFQTSWMEKELYKVRNIRPGFQKGLVWGLINAAFETYVSKGHSPWTLPHKTDHTSLKYKHHLPILKQYCFLLPLE